VGIHWDEIRLLRALERLGGEERADQIDGLQLMLIVAGDEQTTDLDRVSLTRLLYMLSQQGRLSFEIKHDPDLEVPSAEDPRHLQWLWRLRLTDTGRDRPRARVVVERRPETDIDDGRPIPGLALDRFAGVIAAWYTPAQLSKFLRDSGLPRIRSAQPHGSTEDLSANLAAYAQGNSEQRRKLRRFLAALLNGDLDPVADSDQRQELIATLAMAGWHLRDDILVIGQRVIPAKSRATTASTAATALEREAIARAVRLSASAIWRLSRLALAKLLARLPSSRSSAYARTLSAPNNKPRRAEQAETHLDDAAKRAEQHARSERAELDRELGEQREAREAVELERDRAQAALDAEQRLRAQLQADLETAQQRLDVAEKARDATIATGEQPAIPRPTPRRKT
jgi:hypothetical protein